KIQNGSGVSRVLVLGLVRPALLAVVSRDLIDFEEVSATLIAHFGRHVVPEGVKIHQLLIGADPLTVVRKILRVVITELVVAAARLHSRKYQVLACLSRELEESQLDDC